MANGMTGTTLALSAPARLRETEKLISETVLFPSLDGCTLRHRDAPCARESPYSVFNAWRTSVVGSGTGERDDLRLERLIFHLTLAQTRCSSRIPGELAET